MWHHYTEEASCHHACGSKQCQLIRYSVTLQIPWCLAQVIGLSRAIELVKLGRGTPYRPSINMDTCGHAHMSKSVQSRITPVHTAVRVQTMGAPPFNKGRTRDVLQGHRKRRQVPPHMTTQVEQERKRTPLATHSHIHKPTQERNPRPTMHSSRHNQSQQNADGLTNTWPARNPTTPAPSYASPPNPW